MPSNHNVKAVGVILVNKEGKILLQKRDGFAPSSPNKVSAFGGAVEINEEPLQALRRELLEELELDLEVNGTSPRLIHTSPSIKKPGMVINIYLVGDIDDTNLTLHEGEKIVRLDSYADLDDEDKSGSLLNFDSNTVPELP